jgi:hypothetical protein
LKSEIERQAAFYRGYLIDDRSLGPLTVALAAIVALWFVVYLADCIGAMARPTAECPAQRSHLADQPTRLDPETGAGEF